MPAKSYRRRGAKCCHLVAESEMESEEEEDGKEIAAELEGERAIFRNRGGRRGEVRETREATLTVNTNGREEAG